MAKIAVFDVTNKQVGELELNDAVFNTDIKPYLLHDMVRYQLAARRQGTHAVKNRAIVSGGGRKPYKQKGTGNARQGSIRAPHFVGGGVVFGPQPRDYDFKLNRKVKKSALCSALSSRFQGEKLKVLNRFELEQISTKSCAEVLRSLEVEGALIVVGGPNTNLELSARNLKNVKVLRAEGVNVYDVLKYPNLVMTEEAVAQVEGALVR